MEEGKGDDESKAGLREAVEVSEVRFFFFCEESELEREETTTVQAQEDGNRRKTNEQG